MAAVFWRNYAFAAILLSNTLAVSTFSFVGNPFVVARLASMHSENLYLPNFKKTHSIRKSFLQMSNQPGDLSKEEQARGKKLADAWIRQDKALECSKMLQV
jgi:hypothetical protein